MTEQAPDQSAGTGEKKKFHQKRKKRNHNKRKDKKNHDDNALEVFNGATTGLNGHVFQIFGESNKSTQFNTTLKAIMVYVAREFSQGSDIEWMIKNMKEFKIPRPTPPTISSSRIEEDIYKEQIKQVVIRESKYESNKTKLYSIIWGQCSDNMQARLHGIPNFDEMDRSRNVLTLLREIKAVTFDFESQQYLPMSLHNATNKYFTMKQGKNESLVDYHKRFKNVVDVLEHYGANIWYHPSMIVEEYKLLGHNITREDIYFDTVESYTRVGETVKNKCIAIAFLKGANYERYSRLLYDLKSQFSRNMNQYPTTLEQAYHLLSVHEGKHKKFKQARYNNNNRRDVSESEDDEQRDDNNAEQPEMAFVNNANKSRTPECFLCGEEHYVSNFPLKGLLKGLKKSANPNPDKNATNLMIQGSDDICQEVKSDEEEEHKGFGFSFATFAHQADQTCVQVALSQHHKGGKLISDSWLLLDSQSTVNIIKNKNLLTNIRKCKPNEVVRCWCNSGYQDTHEMGTLEGIGEVYYNPSSLANILSLRSIANKFKVTMDTSKERAFTVHNCTKQGHDIKFKQSRSGLHFYDTRVKGCNKLSNPRLQKQDYTLVVSVEQNKLKYTKNASPIGRGGHETV